MGQPLLIDVKDLATLTGYSSTAPEVALAAKRATSRFYGDTHRDSILEETTDEYHNGDGGRVLLLRGAPVSAVEAVTINGFPLIEHADYTLDRRAGILKLRGGREFPKGRLGNIHIRYTHGYKNIPGDVEDAVLEHAVTLVESAAHIQQEGAGSTQASYAKEATVGVTAKWVNAVARYDLDARA